MSTEGQALTRLLPTECPRTGIYCWRSVRQDRREVAVLLVKIHLLVYLALCSHLRVEARGYSLVSPWSTVSRSQSHTTIPVLILRSSNINPEDFLTSICRLEISERSFSMFDSTLGMSRSYHSEDDVGVVLGRKFTQNLADIQDDIDDESSTDEDDPADIVWPQDSLRGDAAERIGISERLGPSLLNHTLPGEVEFKVDLKVEPKVEPKEVKPKEADLKVDPAINSQVDPELPPVVGGSRPQVSGPEIGPEDFDPPDTYGFDWAFWHWNNWLGSTTQKVAIAFIVIFFFSNFWIWSLNKFFDMDVRNLRASPFTYVPPDSPPKDFSEIRTRMNSVEKEIGNFGIYYGQFTAGYTNLISREVSLLKRSIEQARGEGKATGDQLNKELEQLERWQESMRKDYSEVSDGLSALKDKVNEFLDNLPGKIVATQLEDGTYKFSEGFERMLEDILMQRASTIVVPGTGLEMDTPAMAVPTMAFPGWDAFLADNKRQLRDLIDEHTGVKLDKKGGVVLSHGTIKLLIDRKLQEFEDHGKDKLMHDVRNEMERYKTENLLPGIEEYKTKTWLPDAKNALEEYKAETWLPDAKIELEEYKMETWLPGAKTELKDYMTETLVPDAKTELEDYMAKTLVPAATQAARKYINNLPVQEVGPGLTTAQESLDQYADYASQLIGGMIAPFITSPSYDYTSAGDRWYYWLFGRPQRIYPAPVTAITPTKDVGNCWPFAGDHGTVGIRLARPLYPTHVSVEHIPPQIAIDISSAPRDIEFWARFDNKDDRERVESVAARATNEMKWGPGRLWDRESLESPEGPSGHVFNNFVKLAAFKYDIAKGKPKVQTHELGVDFMNLNITARTVIFRITSNWGHPTFTCLYQVKVHGNPDVPWPKVYMDDTIGATEEL